jgi:hypothetical protein
VPFIPGPPQLPIEPCYDPTPEYGKLDVVGGIENGLFGADTEAGMAALDSWLLRVNQVGNLMLSPLYGGTTPSFVRMPNMRTITVSDWGYVYMSNAPILDGVLRAENCPKHAGTALEMAGCGLTSLTGDACKIFGLLEYGDYSFRDNALPQSAVDAILAGAAASETIQNSLDLSGGTNAPPSVTGLAAIDYLQNTLGWTIYVNEAE